MLEFYTTAHPKAKKDHVCDLCNGTIRKGEKYHRYSGKNDGYMFDYKYHLICQKIIDAYCDTSGDNEYSNDAIWDFLSDEYCFDCELHKNDECANDTLSCPIIRKYYESEGEK